jgi:hypothetical protein
MLYALKQKKWYQLYNSSCEKCFTIFKALSYGFMKSLKKDRKKETNFSKIDKAVRPEPVLFLNLR